MLWLLRSVLDGPSQKGTFLEWTQENVNAALFAILFLCSNIQKIISFILSFTLVTLLCYTGKQAHHPHMRTSFFISSFSKMSLSFYTKLYKIGNNHTEAPLWEQVWGQLFILLTCQVQHITSKLLPFKIRALDIPV